MARETKQTGGKNPNQKTPTTSKPENPKNFQKPILFFNPSFIFPAEAGRQNWVLPFLKNLLHIKRLEVGGEGTGVLDYLLLGAVEGGTGRGGGQVLVWKLACGGLALSVKCV